MTDPAPALVAVTASALDRVRDFLAGAPDPSDRVLSVRVTGVADGEYVCALSLEPLAKVRAGDTVQHEGDLAIVVAEDSVAKLRGATVDWSEDPLHSGFVVVNPNKPAAPPLALPTLPMTRPSDLGRVGRLHRGISRRKGPQMLRFTHLELCQWVREPLFLTHCAVA